MKLKVREIPKNGLRLEQDVTVEGLDLEREGVKFAGPLHITANVEKGYNNIQIRVEIAGRMRFSCGRCLEEYEQVLKKGFNTVRPDDQEAIIDITELVREEIMLDYPLKFLCKEDCKGLCVRCGKNLNEGSCACKKNKEGLANKARLKDK